MNVRIELNYFACFIDQIDRENMMAFLFVTATLRTNKHYTMKNNMSQIV